MLDQLGLPAAEYLARRFSLLRVVLRPGLPDAAVIRFRRRLRLAAGVGRRLRGQQVGLVEVLAAAELAAQPHPGGLLRLPGGGLQVLHAAQVDGDLAPRAEADQPLLHLRFPQPGDARLPRRARFLQLAQQLADRFVAARRSAHQRLELLGYEQIGAHVAVDRLRYPRAFRAVGLDVERACRRLPVVPGVEDGEAVEALGQHLAELALVLAA